jgi:hypothetical protein
MGMSVQVTEYIRNADQPWKGEACSRIRQIVHEAIHEVEERIQYGKPHFLKNGKYAAVLGTAKGWVSFTIFNASALEAPDGFFEVDGSPERKTIKIRQGQTVDYNLLATLLQQAANAQ